MSKKNNRQAVIASSETKKSSIWQQLKSNGLTVVISILIAVLIRIFLAEPRYIPSESMFPTLSTGDRLVVEKLSYKFHPPEVGDIVVFHPPSQLILQGYDPNQAFIKRVIATEGQIVEIRNSVVYVNGVALKEKYVAQSPEYELKAVQVPKGGLFVLGDNRNLSNDSHIWGFLPQENAIGHAIWRYWPLSKFGDIA